MLQHQIVAYLDKGLLNADAGNIEQASQYYRKGEENINRLPRPKIQNFDHNSAMTIPSTPLSIASTISTPKKPKIIGRKRLIS